MAAGAETRSEKKGVCVAVLGSPFSLGAIDGIIQIILRDECICALASFKEK